jgi:hypothetical protein
MGSALAGNIFTAQTNKGKGTSIFTCVIILKIDINAVVK